MESWIKREAHKRDLSPFVVKIFSGIKEHFQETQELVQLSGGIEKFYFVINTDETEFPTINKVNNGGIDLNSTQIDLTSKGNGDADNFDIDPALLKRMQNAPGVTPVIVGIHSLDSLQQFLEIHL